MIHIVDDHLAATKRPLLRSMFADRKRLFVDLFGWDVPVIEDQYEVDQFDNADTIYLIVADDDGGHAASIRLFPTIRPHMLNTIFPHLCPLGVPVDKRTWESTRLCLPQRHGAGRRRELRNMLFSAMVDRPVSRPDDWAGIVRGTDARLGAATDSEGEETGGGLEQARHPGQELDRTLMPDPITADPLGLSEDDGDLAADARAMDQAQALGTARAVYAIDEADHRPGDLQLDL